MEKIEKCIGSVIKRVNELNENEMMILNECSKCENFVKEKFEFQGSMKERFKCKQEKNECNQLKSEIRDKLRIVLIHSFITEAIPNMVKYTLPASLKIWFKIIRLK